MKSKRLTYLISGTFLVAAVLVALQPGNVSLAQTQKAKQINSTAARRTQSSNGELKFEQNCSRCHNAPESFPPSISGTILRHMRVRASLSKQDEQDILHFLNP